MKVESDDRNNEFSEKRFWGFPIENVWTGTCRFESTELQKHRKYFKQHFFGSILKYNILIYLAEPIEVWVTWLTNHCNLWLWKKYLKIWKSFVCQFLFRTYLLLNHVLAFSSQQKYKQRPFSWEKRTLGFRLQKIDHIFTNTQ